MKKRSNITVNGKPLTEYLDANSSRRNGGAVRSSRGVVLYSADQKAQKVFMAGRMWSWAEKAPFPESGYSVYGAVEFTADELQLRCHECGDWMPCVSQHLHQHGITSADYRIRHGLSKHTPLENATLISKRVQISRQQFALHPERRHNLKPGWSPAAVKRLSVIRQIREELGHGRTHSPEYDNVRAHCRAQLVETVQLLAKQRGRTPTDEELRIAKIYPCDTKALFGSVKNLLQLAGLNPRPPGINVLSPEARRARSRNAATTQWATMSPEQRRQRKRRLQEAARKRWAAMSPEQQQQTIQHLRDARRKQRTRTRLMAMGPPLTK